MGNCPTQLTQEEKEARVKGARNTREIESFMTQDHEEQQKIAKLLLLGAGESGKSTIFKQMKVIHGEGFTDEERMAYRGIIFSNIIYNMKTLVRQSDHPKWGKPTSERVRESKEFVQGLRQYEEFDEKIAEHISTLWKDKGIRATYEKRACYQLSDNAEYFFNKLEEVADERYIPSKDDILHARNRTTGIIETAFTVQGNKFEMYDVGGQRNERKKWIFCFENVTAVLFVAAMSEYDQVLYEDGKTNRTKEALDLFEEICNSKWFKETSMILFLNKSDLFAEKIKKISLTLCFPDFTGDQDLEPCTTYLREQFLIRNHNTKQVYVHITCATNTNNIATVFDATKDIILRNNIRDTLV